jgi:hypothetical protein
MTIIMSVLKTSIIVLIAAAVAALVSVAYNSTSARRALEGMGNADSAAGADKPGGKIPDEDDDLKCAGPKRGETKCTVPDVIRLGYELASDPALSQGEMEKISSVFKSRASEKGNEKLGEKLGGIFNRFMGDVMLLRFSVMFNTSPNEPELKKVMDDMIKKKDGRACYSTDDMKQVKGLLVGTAEQKTLSVAQSEAMRCYMQRFNSVRACMGICDSNRA